MTSDHTLLVCSRKSEIKVSVPRQVPEAFYLNGNDEDAHGNVHISGAGRGHASRRSRVRNNGIGHTMLPKHCTRVGSRTRNITEMYTWVNLQAAAMAH